MGGRWSAEGTSLYMSGCVVHDPVGHLHSTDLVHACIVWALIMLLAGAQMQGDLDVTPFLLSILLLCLYMTEVRGEAESTLPLAQ